MNNERAQAPPARDKGDRPPALSDAFDSHRDAVVVGALFVTTLTLHVLTAARAVTFSDSGDFLMAIKTVGNCHGPGYPLFLMSAKLFSLLLPFGSLAFRTSIYSGLFAALTVCLIYWIVFRMSHSRVGGAVAALAYGFSYTFWYQSAIPETYSLNTFFIALLIVLILRWERQIKSGAPVKADNTLCLFALTYGLALSNHYTVIFIFPAFLYFALLTDWRRVIAPRNVLRMAAFFALGLLPYLYEPAAAFRGPAYNYGDPATLTNWIHQVTLYYQRGGLFKYPYKVFPERLARYFGTLNTEFPYFAWLAGIGFLYSFTKRSKKYPLFLVLLFLLSLLTVMTYQQIESVLRAHFYYPSYLVVSLWVGMGAAFFWNLAKRWSSRRDPSVAVVSLTVVGVLLLSSAGVAAFEHFHKVDKSSYYYAHDMARDILETAEPGSVVLVEDDNVVFPCKYLQVDELLRPDVRVIVSHSAGVPGWQGEDLLLTYLPPDKTIPVVLSKNNEIIARNSTLLPVYSTSAVDTAYNYDWQQVWQGFMVRILPAGAKAVESPRKTITTMRGVDSPHGDIDSDAREALLMPQAMRAGIEAARKDYAEASALYRKIIPRFLRDLYVPTLYSCETYSNLYNVWGLGLNQTRAYNETVSQLPNANKIDPDFISLQLAFAYGSTGHRSDALAELKKFLSFNPFDLDALTERAQIYLDRGDSRSARRDLEEAVTVAPNDAEAHYLLGVALLPSDRKGAKREFEAAVRLDPQGQYGRLARVRLDKISK
jgi:tetratricopeptide (TPR) repeat protein